MSFIELTNTAKVKGNELLMRDESESDVEALVDWFRLGLDACVATKEKKDKETNGSAYKKERARLEKEIGAANEELQQCVLSLGKLSQTLAIMNANH